MKGLQSTNQEKIPTKNSIYAHAQDFSVNDELLLAIVKALVPEPLNKLLSSVFLCLRTLDISKSHVIQSRILSQTPTEHTTLLSLQDAS
jgi:hypothetical protein